MKVADLNTVDFRLLSSHVHVGRQRFKTCIGSGCRTLVDGQEVEFEVGEGRRDPKVVDVEAV